MSDRLLSLEESMRRWLKAMIEGTLVGRATIAAPRIEGKESFGRSALPSTTVVTHVGGGDTTHQALLVSAQAPRTMPAGGGLMSWTQVQQRVGFEQFVLGGTSTPLPLTGNYTLTIGFEWTDDHHDEGDPFDGGGTVRIEIDGQTMWPIIADDPVWHGVGTLFVGTVSFFAIRGQTLSIRVVPPEEEFRTLRNASLSIRADGQLADPEVPPAPQPDPPQQPEPEPDPGPEPGPVFMSLSGSSPSSPGYILLGEDKWTITGFPTGWPNIPTLARSVSFDEDRSLMILAAGSRVTTINLETKVKTDLFDIGGGPISWDVALSPNGQWLACAFSSAFGPPGLVMINMSTMERDVSWPLVNVNCRSVSWSPDGTKLIVGVNSIPIRVIDVATKTLEGGWGDLPSSPGSQRWRWSPDGQLIAGASGGNRLWVIDPSTKSQDSGWLATSGGTIRALAWSPDSARIAVLWDHDGQYLLRVVLRSTKNFEGGWPTLTYPLDSTQGRLAWKPDGTKLAVIVDDSSNKLRVIDVASKTIDTTYPQAGSFPMALSHVRSMAWWPDPGGMISY